MRIYSLIQNTVTLSLSDDICFAVNPKTWHAIPIADRIISIEEMEDRSMVITQGGGDEKLN